MFLAYSRLLFRGGSGKSVNTSFYKAINNNAVLYSFQGYDECVLLCHSCMQCCSMHAPQERRLLRRWQFASSMRGLLVTGRLSERRSGHRCVCGILYVLVCVRSVSFHLGSLLVGYFLTPGTHFGPPGGPVHGEHVVYRCQRVDCKHRAQLGIARMDSPGPRTRAVLWC